MSIRPSVRALARYSFTPRDQAVKLDQNESPEDLPAPLKDEILRRLRATSLNRYPDLHPVSLQAAFARRHDWDPAGVVVTGGSNVLLQALAIVAGLGRSVLTVRPTFSVYGLQARLLDAELVEIPLGRGFSLPLDDVLAAMRGRSGVLFLANPAAPTGNLLPADDVRALLAAGGDDWLVVIDEAYGEFAGSDHAELVRGAPGAASLRTLSKAFALAGARVGYGLFAPDTAAEVRKAVLPFSVSALQAAVASTVLEAPAYVDERVARARTERDRLLAGMRSLPGVEAFPSVTNFVLFRVDDPGRVYHGLLERDVVVRRQDHVPGLDGCLRVTAGAAAETDAFLEALRDVLAAEAVRG